jgi:hypothetical protein
MERPLLSFKVSQNSRVKTELWGTLLPFHQTNSNLHVAILKGFFETMRQLKIRLYMSYVPETEGEVTRNLLRSEPRELFLLQREKATTRRIALASYRAFDSLRV